MCSFARTDSPFACVVQDSQPWTSGTLRFWIHHCLATGRFLIQEHAIAGVSNTHCNLKNTADTGSISRGFETSADS